MRTGESRTKDRPEHKVNPKQQSGDVVFHSFYELSLSERYYTLPMGKGAVLEIIDFIRNAG